MWENIHEFLTSALVGDEWSVSRPGHFTPEERVPEIVWGLRVSVDDEERRNILPLPRPELRPFGPLANSQCPRNC
jgi:hypothetical protein